MRLRLAGLALMLCAASAAAAPADPDTQRALDNALAALDGAEQALGQCPQPELRIPARAAIFDARQYIRVARANPGAMAVLDAKLQLVKDALKTCLVLRQSADDYHARCRGEVRLGMTADEVRQTAWCLPTKILTTETTGRKREEWIYTSNQHEQWMGRPVGFLYFTDGRLTSIQRSSR